MTNTTSGKQMVFQEATAIKILLIYTKIHLKKTKYKNIKIEKSINFKLNKILDWQNGIICFLYFSFMIFLSSGLLLKIFSNSKTLKIISAITLIGSGLLFFILTIGLTIVLFFDQRQKSRSLIAQSQKISKKFKDKYEIENDHEENLSQSILDEINDELLKSNTQKELIEKSRENLIKYIDKNSLSYLADCIDREIQSKEEKQEQFIYSAPLVICALIIIAWLGIGSEENRIREIFTEGDFNTFFLALMGLSPVGLLCSGIITLLLSSKPETVKMFEEWQLILKRSV